MATGNATFTTFLTSTLRNYRSKLIENLMGHNALYWQLKKRGFVTEESGSRSIVQPLMYGQNSTVGSYAGWDLLDVTPQEGITAAEYAWKFIAGTVTISGEEEFKNSGSKTRIFNLLEAKIRQLELSMQLQMNIQLFSDGSGNNGKDITGLLAAVQDGGAWSEYGGIDSAVTANAWWRNMYVAFATSYTAGWKGASGKSVEGLSMMRNVYNTVSLGNSKPSLIITNQGWFERYEGDIEGDKLRLTSTELADAGFQNLTFKGCPMIFDEDLQANTMLFLNSDFMKFVIGKGRNFVNTPFVKPQNQDAKVSQVLFAGQLTLSKRDQHARVNGIDDS
jgi:hypothetical protein